MGELEKKWGTWILVVAGANWGLVGLGHFLGINVNLINLLFGSWPVVENIVYVVVGLCSLTVAWMQFEKK